MKTIKTNRSNMVIFLIYLLLISCEEPKSESSIYILPTDFTGPVVIIHNQADGKEEEYEEGKRVYRIEEDGVLITQFKQNYGYRFHTMYYENNNERIKIPLIFPTSSGEYKEKMDNDSIYAFNFNISKSRSGEINAKAHEITTFYIGNTKDFNKTAWEVHFFRIAIIERLENN